MVLCSPCVVHRSWLEYMDVLEHVHVCVCMHGLPCSGMWYYVSNSASKSVFVCRNLKTHVKPHQHTVADTVAHTMASTRTHVQGTLLMCEVHMHLDDLE